MPFQVIHGVPVWGEPLDNAVEQIVNCSHEAAALALMADHHLGYGVPIGGVVAYDDQVSPAGVGYDIACGNKAARLDIPAAEVKAHIKPIMDDIWRTISFGVGRKNLEKTALDHPLFEDDPAWHLPVARKFKKLAAEQLGTVGSGNHYVDIFEDEQARVWLGVHFGSRGLGHRLATHFIDAAERQRVTQQTPRGTARKDSAPALLRVDTPLGQDYLACMRLGGRYAYAGRDWVCQRVASMLGARIVEEIHNHHNFAWQEEHDGRNLWVTRKGATPAFPGQKGFVGGSMGDISVILEGMESAESKTALHSTVHGAGRIMSRTQASGRSRWRKGRKVQLKPGQIGRKQMLDHIGRMGVELRGAGTDEAPQVYKHLPAVLEHHRASIRILHTFTPLGVAMAGEDEYDPYRD